MLLYLLFFSPSILLEEGLGVGAGRICGSEGHFIFQIRSGTSPDAGRGQEQNPEEPRLSRIGIIGTVIAALCCFTPVLVILFGVVGLSWLVGYLCALAGLVLLYRAYHLCGLA